MSLEKKLCLLYFFHILSRISLKAVSPADIKLQYNFVHFSIVHDQVILFNMTKSIYCLIGF